jgi:D-3-phosphoglycerate dehydrogenase
MTHILTSTSTFDRSNLDDNDLAALERAGIGVVGNPYGRKLTEDEAIALLDGAIGVIAGLEPLNDRVLRSAPSLRAIARVGIGLDTVDLAAATELGIHVMNTPEPPAQAVAELTIGHILGVLRHIARADRAIRTGNWQGQFGTLLAGKTVGVVGYGRIGRRVATLLEAFGAIVIVHDPYITDDSITLVSLDELTRTSDIITIHVPYSKHNHHLFDARRLAAMKPGAIIVNVARGGLIDEAALADVLSNGPIAGAALDCFENEPYSGPLIGFDNVQMTAHMGTYASETRGQMERQAASQLIEYLRRIGEVR